MTVSYYHYNIGKILLLLGPLKVNLCIIKNFVKYRRGLEKLNNQTSKLTFLFNECNLVKEKHSKKEMKVLS